MFTVLLSKYLLSFIKLMKDVLTFTLPIPVFVVILTGIWYVYDKNSAVKHAVEKAVTQLVAGAELAAKDALIKTQQDQLEFQKAASARQEQRLQDEIAANESFRKAMQLSSSRTTNLMERLNELQKQSDTNGTIEQFIDFMSKQQPEKTK